MINGNSPGFGASQTMLYNYLSSVIWVLMDLKEVHVLPKIVGRCSFWFLQLMYCSFLPFYSKMLS